MDYKGKSNQKNTLIEEQLWNISEQQQAGYIEKIQKFCLLDDDFMTKCFENNIEAIELVLHIVLKQPELKIVSVHTQHVIKNLQGHSVQLDVLAVDTLGKHYNIEVQRANAGAEPHRARYNSSIVDANILPEGVKYKDLKDTYVIFITENDVFGDNVPIQHFNRISQETGRKFSEGAHILYVNGKYRNDDELGWLMQDFSCTDPDDMHYEVLAKRVRYLKENEKGVRKMCKMLEEMCAEVAEQVRKVVTEAVTEEVTEKVTREVTQQVTQQVTKEKAIATAKSLFLIGKLTLEEIASCVGLSAEEVQQMTVAE